MLIKINCRKPKVSDENNLLKHIFSNRYKKQQKLKVTIHYANKLF